MKKLNIKYKRCKPKTRANECQDLSENVVLKHLMVKSRWFKAAGLLNFGAVKYPKPKLIRVKTRANECPDLTENVVLKHLMFKSRWYKAAGLLNFGAVKFTKPKLIRVKNRKSTKN